MDSEENQPQVALTAHSPWKSLLRFPHSHSREEPVGKWKSQKQAFPLSHCSACPLFEPRSKNQERRPGGGRYAPPPGSFFDEKMLEALRLGVTDSAAVMHIMRVPDAEQRRQYAIELAAELEQFERPLPVMDDYELLLADAGGVQ